MKLAVRLSLVLNAMIGIGLLLLLLHGGPPFVSAQGEPSGNGDVNGSGDIDIADAVYLLSYLFASGAPPVAWADGGLTTEQSEILGCMSMADLPDGQGGTARTLRISGVNVQIVNNMGSTHTVNGVGNLIVGYQEQRTGTNYRTGSHNIIVGQRHDYTCYGGLVAGIENTISGAYASVSGGEENEASGNTASVSGGRNNKASGSHAFVGGGGWEDAETGNEAFGDYSAILGGLANLAGDSTRTNHALGRCATVSGGAGNTASGQNSSVSGGNLNTASGSASSVSGGKSRTSPGANDWTAGSLFEDI